MTKKKIFPCSVFLDGEYGLSDIAIGVPVVLGKNGIERICEIELDKIEKNMLSESASGVNKTNEILKEMKII